MARPGTLTVVYDQFGAPAASRPPGRRWLRVAVAAVVTVLVLVAAGVVWLQRQVNPPGGPGRPVQLTVSQGMSASSISQLLQRQGVVVNATVFRLYLRLKGTGPIQAGDYEFRRHDRLSRVADILKNGGKTEVDRITIPEGLTLAEIADRVGRLPGRSAARFLDVARSGTVRSQYQPEGSNNLEGLILPDTYFVDKHDDETKILVRMVQAFDTEVGRLGVEGGAGEGLSPYQRVVVASLVEREAKVDDDRGMIAQVIYNRLAKKMPLQIDATIQYALHTNKRLLLSDLKVNSPYNTYLNTGLPPAPIASPGRKSLEAAVNPTPGPWLYYVLADANGRHAFATTFAEFERLKAQAQAKGLL